MAFEDVQDKSVKDRLFDKTVEGMEYALKKSPMGIPEKFIAMVSRFVKEKWDEIFAMYDEHFPGADLEKVLDMMDSPEYIKFLDFNVTYQAWINKEMMAYMMEHGDEVDAILDEEEEKEKQEMADLEEIVSDRIDEIKDRENNADDDSFWSTN